MPTRSPGDDADRPIHAADEPLDVGDDHALAVLRHALEASDPVPGDLVERATFAVALDEVWAEVAQIQRMPADDAELAGVRGTANDVAQSMTFTVDAMTVMVTIGQDTGDTVRLDGWVSPGGEHGVALRLPGETLHTVAVAGRFEFVQLPHGMVQLVVEDPDDPGRPMMVTPAVQV